MIRSIATTGGFAITVTQAYESLLTAIAGLRH